jgi:glycerol kinase
MIFDKSGAVIAISQKEHQQFTPHPGWVEHDAGEIWQNTQSVIQEAVAAAGKKAGLASIDISAIGITNQRETIVAWDAQTGKALHHAIVWQDTRTADFLDELVQSDKDLLTNRTGLAIAPYF